LQHALAGSSTADALERLRPPPGFLDPQRFAETMIDALQRSEDMPSAVLILDDVQRVTSTEATRLLDYVLRWAPEALRLVLASRSDPPVTARLALDGRVEVLRQAELAFSDEEATWLLERSGVRLEPRHLAAVIEAVAGWPAGTRLAALALRDVPDAPDAGAAAVALATNDQALSDYLVGEVLGTLPPRMRSFVLRATVDDQVCGALVDHVTGDVDGEALLATCVRENVFLTVARDDADRRWYSWHQVFANHMRRRIAFEAPDQARADAIRAADWWLPRDPVKAADHLFAGGQPDSAGEVIASAWLGESLRGRAGPLLAIAERLPPRGSFTAEIELAQALAGVQTRDADSAREALRRSRSAAADLPSEHRARYEAHAAVLRLLLVSDHEDLESAVAGARQAGHEVVTSTWQPDTVSAAFTAYGLGMGLARLQVELPEAIDLLQRAQVLARQADLPVVDLMARAEICVPLITAGRLGAVATHAEHVLRDAAASGWEALPLGLAKGYLGWYAYWQDRLDDARELLAEAYTETLQTDWANRWLVVYFHTMACLAAGDLAAAAAGIHQAEELQRAGSLPAYAPSMLLGLRADLAVSQGRPVEAVALVEGAVRRPAYRLALVAWADILRRAGRPDECLQLLTEVPDEDRYPQVRASMDVISALAHAAAGRSREAHECLEAALVAAADDLLYRPFAAQRAELAPLLADHQQQGTARPEFLAVVLDRVRGAAGSRQMGLEHLTAREMSVLVYLPTPMSSAEIAAARRISINTVKTHLASIYRKLGVDGRREAVRRADALGLLRSQPDSASVGRPQSDLHEI
jgi:LuxR family maltose regulon positive regulatory protein